MPNRALRLPSRVLVQVRAPRGTFDATIGNLSGSGARLLGVPDRMLRIGDRINIHCSGQDHVAEVHWHFDDTCGVMFLAPLSEGNIVTILGSRFY